MSVVSVNPRSFILALFIRDDGERFLLGDKGYDFKDSQLHFAANTIENDEVMKQGADGVMVAGQVRRASVQSFDGFVGDATMAKETIEQMRRDFFAFFVKGHHFRVIYVDCNRNAWQRKGGYLVDAPEVKELWQIHPEYHVGLNFEDVNYYSYDEDADGEEILSNLVDVPVSTAASGGLVWDEDGAVSEDAEVEYISETAVATPAKNVYITDAAEAPLSSFQLYGETSQNGTPTPSTPIAVNTTTGENVVKITGKNIINTDNTVGEQTQNGVTASMSGSVISIDGEGTGADGSTSGMNRTWALTTQIPLAAGTYSISGTLLSGSWTAAAQSRLRSIRINLSSGTYKEVSASNGSTTLVGNTFTLTEATNVVSVQIMVYGQVKFYDAEFGLQLESGSTATAYEPYQGQSYEVNLGKNLLDPSTLTAGYIRSDNGEQYIGPGKDDNGERSSGFIKVEPNTTYTMSIIIDTLTYDSWFGIGEYTTANSSGFIRRDTQAITTAKTYTFTTASNCQYVRASARNLAAAAGVQLEKGSQATSYAAYFTPIELCKIGTYQDYIYKSGGKWYAHKEVVKYTFNGSEDWTIRQGNNVGLYHISLVEAILLPASASAMTQALSSHFKAASNDAAWSSNGNPCFSAINGSSPCVLRFSKGEATNDLAAWKTWLGSNNVSVYAILATPTDTEITNQALIAQLEAVLGGHTYAGVNNITTITPNEQGTLEISYYTKYQPVVVSGGYVWEVGGSGGATTVINNSIDNVSPIWKIYGPTTNPQLENSTTGEVIEYVGVIAEGQTLTIDMGEQTASLDGLNVISNLVGDFISLAPGANRLIYSVLGDAGASSIGWSEIVG